MTYKFIIEVREGKPGFADDATYTSWAYKSFKDVYSALVNFDIRRHWPHFRTVQNMYIKQDEGVWVDSCRNGEYQIYVDDLPSLGVTELEFDAIIADINKNVEK